VLAALGDPDTTIAVTEQRVGAVLHAVITDEHRPYPRPCNGALQLLSQREATRLHNLAEAGR
jgi:hypothetical protein